MGRVAGGFDENRGVWKSDETLSLVFDISSKSKPSQRSKQRNKIVKIYGIQTSVTFVLFFLTCLEYVH